MRENYTRNQLAVILKRFSGIAMALLLLVGTVSAQDTKKYDLKLTKVPLSQAIEKIESMSGSRFMYNPQVVDVSQLVTVDLKQQTIPEIVSAMLNGKGIGYRFSGSQIILYVGGASQPAGTTAEPSATPAQSGQAPQSGASTPGRVASTAAAAFNISGVVTDSDTDKPLPGVSVLVLDAPTKGYSLGVVSDASGRYTAYSINSGRDSLQFRCVGYKTLTILINNRQTINVSLQPDVIKVKDVVVTGYQTLSKQRATGAYEILGPQEIAKNVNINAISVLDGQAAGVSTYGDKILIRGANTFSTRVGTSPLVVIDGLPTERDINSVNMNNVESFYVLKDAAAASIYGVRAANGVIVITTKRGTKGRTDVQLTTDWKWTMNPSLADYRLASTSQIMDYEMANYQAGANNSYAGNLTNYLNNNLRGIGEYSGSTSMSLAYVTPLYYLMYQKANGLIGDDQYNSQLAAMRKIDYRKEYMDDVWKTPLRQSYNLSVSTATDRTNVFASFNFIKNRDRIDPQNSNQMKGYVKASQKVNKWLNVEVGADLQYSNTLITDNNYANLFNLEAYTQIRDADGNRVYREGIGSYNQMFTSGLSINPKLISQVAGRPQFESYRFNILDELERNKNRAKNITARPFVSASAQLVKGLKFTTSFTYETTSTSTAQLNEGDSYWMRFGRNRYATYASTNTIIPAGGRYMRQSDSGDDWTFRNQFDFKRTFCSNHALDISVGAEWREVQTDPSLSSVYYGYNSMALTSQNANMDMKNLLAPGFNTSYMYNNNTSISAVLGGSNIAIQDPYFYNGQLASSLNRFLGLYAVGGYTFKDRYNISGSYRLDRTNLFGAGKYRSRPLWSVGFKWNADRESFLSSAHWINMLALRTSYGWTGNVDPTSSPYRVGNLGSNSSFTAVGVPTAWIATAPNPMLRWERTASYNAGLDFNFWSGILSGKFDIYYKKSDDLLASVPLPYAAGYATGPVNYGVMSNRGFEVTLSSNWLKTQNWRLSSTLMFSYNRNSVDKAYFAATSASHLVDGIYYQKGKPLNALFVYRYGGLTSGQTLPNGKPNNVQNGVPIILSANGTPLYTFGSDGSLGIPDNTLGPDDALYVGSKIPLWNGSFTQGISYKGWDLSAMFTFYGGNKILMPTFDFNADGSPSVHGGQVSQWIVNSWTPSNTSSEIPKSIVYYTSATNLINLSSYYHKSTAAVAKGDMLRLRTLSLTYNLPRRLCESLKLQQVRLTGQANNLFYMSASGIDPETNTNAYYYTPVTPTSYFLRVDITF